DPKTGELIGRRDLSLGAASTPLCPAIAGAISWNAGSYNPKTGLWYKIVQEWCMDIEVGKTTPITEQMSQLNIGANFMLVAPPNPRPCTANPTTACRRTPARSSCSPRSNRRRSGGRPEFVALPLPFRCG